MIRRKDFLHVRFVLLKTLMAPFCFIVAGVMEYARYLLTSSVSAAKCSVLSIIRGNRSIFTYTLLVINLINSNLFFLIY